MSSHFSLPIDGSIVGLYLLITMLAGLAVRKYVRRVEDFLVAGREIATELMQDQFTAENLSARLLELLEPETNKAMRANLREVAHKLGEPGASRRAAKLIVSFLQD